MTDHRDPTDQDCSANYPATRMAGCKDIFPMKRILIASAAVMALVAPMTAYAAPPKAHKAKTHSADTTKIGTEEYTSGVVSAYTPDTRMLKLNAGQEFKLAPSITNTSYKAGDKVTVRWTMKDGARLADSVSAK
jgi:hypothetical protein